MKIIVTILFLIPLLSAGQIYTEETLLSRLKNDGVIGEDVLSKRSAVLHSYTITSKEIATIHENLSRTGIDAVAYFKTDGVLAEGDIASSYAEYFVKREITNLVIIQKTSTGFVINITSFNGKPDFVNQGQSSWRTSSSSLGDGLATIYRTALAS
ncbi:MAG TPA: hypothetical protein VGK39_00830, partial [Cyclobacteriaceae bacterium]